MAPEDIREMASKVRESLGNLGVHLRESWVAHCLNDPSSSLGGAEDGGAGSCDKACEEIYRIFLACDLREAGTACLPAGVAEMVENRIEGKMVLQVEGARDIAKTLEQRESGSGTSAYHTLKLALGDGAQTVVAFEYRRIQGLCADPAPGLKVLVVEPWVRRGILLLSAENTTVLGGQVGALVKARDAARRRKKDKPSTTASTTTLNTAADADADADADVQAGDGSNGNDKSTLGPNPDPNVRRGVGGGEHDQGRQRRQEKQGQDRREVRHAAANESGASDRQELTVSTPGSNGRSRARRAAIINPYTRKTNKAINDTRSSVPPSLPIGNPETAANGKASTTASKERLESQGRKRKAQQQVRMPAFMDDDDGPGFEYLEEEEADSKQDERGTLQQQQQQDEHEMPPPDDDIAEFSILAAPRTISFPSSKPKTLPASKVAPPEMANARGQSERRRATRPHGGSASIQVVDVVDKESECEILGVSRGSPEGRRLAHKRPRTPTESNTGGEQRLPKKGHPPPQGPYTSLADLEALNSSGGVYRVKALVADTVACKIRKKEYRLVIDIEDGTAVMRVRLCESIGKRIFGLEAREYRKMFQSNPERAQEIQSRVENDIRQMEGVMELNTSPTVASAQSPPGPRTPGGLSSQGSTSSDAELSLPVVLSITPPTLEDYRKLLARVEAS